MTESKRAGALKLLKVPERGTLPDCYINVKYIVSLYHAAAKVFIELSTGKTINIGYDNEEAATKAYLEFHDFLTGDLETPEGPKPKDGAIFTFK